MAFDTFEAAMPHLFRHEGGYADHPSDPGGATKYGITRATLAAWRGRSVSKSDVRRLARREAAAIYRARYWNAVRADDLPAGVDYCVFDAAVNSGPARAAKWLQAAARVTQDGVIGPATLSAISRADPGRLIDDACDVRLAFLRGLSTFAVFGRGWERRVGDVRATAASMAAAMTAPVAAPDVGNRAPDARDRASDGTPADIRPAPAPGFWAAVAALLRAILTGGRDHS